MLQPFLITVCLGMLPWSSAQATAATRLSADAPASATLSKPITLPTVVLQRVMQSVVAIQTDTDDDANSSRTLGQQREGSGVVIGPDLVLTVGYLLIEAHTVNLIDRQGRIIPGQVRAVDTISGLGLVRALVPLGLEPVLMGDSDALIAPAKVLNLGQNEAEPTELQLVSRHAFAGSWEYLLEAPLITWPAVNNWSGSGLFDDHGHLIGLGSLLLQEVQGGPPGMTGNLFIPINEVKASLADLLRLGKRTGPAQAWLGIHSKAVPGGGLGVLRVTPDSPAAQAGIRPGDILLSLQDKRIDDLPDFYRRLWALGPAGSPLELTVRRSGQDRIVRLTSGNRAQSMKKPRSI